MPIRAWPKLEQVDGGQPGQHVPVEGLEVFQVDQHGVAKLHLRLDVDVDAVGTAAEPGVVEHEVEHLGEGQRDHDEIHAAGTQHEEAGDQRERGAGQYGGGQGGPQVAGFVLRAHQCDDVAGQPEKGGVAEADQPGVADQQVEAHGEDGHDHHLGNELDVELLADEGEGGERGDHRDQGQRGHHSALHRLNSPSGRHSSTAAISTYTASPA
jgi:hypothetical protein